MPLALASIMPRERVKKMTHDNTINQTVTMLTQRISQILDDAKHLTDVNMGSRRGRQIVAAEIARQLIDSRG